MFVTPLAKKGIATAPISKGDIINVCYPPVQSSGVVTLLDASKIAAGDVILIKAAEAPHEIKFPTAENLLKAIKGNLEKTSPEPTSNYLVAQAPKFDLVNETDKLQAGVSFTRVFFGDDQLPEGETIILSPNTGIFFTEEGLDSLASGNITFITKEWKRLKIEVMNSSLPIALKGSTPAFTHQNGVQVDSSVIKYATVGMSVYTPDDTIFDSVEGEVKVIAVDHNNSIIYLSEDNVSDSSGFVFTLSPTINVTPLEGAAPGLTSVAWGAVLGDMANQTDLSNALDILADGIAASIPFAIFDAKGDIIAGTGDNACDNLTVGTNGSFLRAASGQTTGLEWQKNNMNAAVDPVATDDIDLGYTPGSRWLNTTLGREFVCISNANDAAVWLQTTQAGEIAVTLASGTLSGATVDVLNIPATYRYLQIHFAVSFDTASRFLEIVWSSDNGSTWSTNGIDGVVTNGATPTAVLNSASLVSHTAQAAATAAIGSVIISGYSSSILPLLVIGNGYSTDGTIAWSTSRSTRTTSVLNALRFRPNGSGVMDGGFTYKVIGVY